MNTQEVRGKYDSAIFGTFEDGLIATLSISDYKNVSDFTSTFICLPPDGDQTYYFALSVLYKKIFNNYDSSFRQKEAWNIFKGENGLEEDELEYECPYHIWSLSSFCPDIDGEIGDGSMKIIYQEGMADTRENGAKVWRDIQNAAVNYEYLYNKHPECMDFYRFGVSIQNEDNSGSLFEFEVERKLNGKWETLVSNFGGEEFMAGVYDQQ